MVKSVDGEECVVKGGGVRCGRTEVRTIERGATDHLQLVQHPIMQLLEMALGVQSKEWLKEQDTTSILPSHSPSSLLPSLSVHCSNDLALFSGYPN